eukprot:TRINITY_DN10773_c0_g1_i2.p1 TRINITY_DN10773_c0_g1~~TRINITY_DN10773_c0_g1_i2.p1  ORF type:complete len:199 (-),score=44.29 TRINITY_DN10773_c0_g1_i2:268-864(-)
MEPEQLTATPAHCALCFDTLVQELCGVPGPVVQEEDLTQVSLFVTWLKRHNNSDQLRGCLGTFEKPTLTQGLRDFSLKSGLKDSRFPPIEVAELPLLSCSVSLLVQFETVADPMDWEVGTHGVEIQFVYNGKHHSATFLPHVPTEQGWDQKRTLEALVHKAGVPSDQLPEIWDSIQLTRYQSSKSSMSYAQWHNLRHP